MITTLAELNDDIMEAYAKARAAMEKLEFTRGVSISRGTSLAYKTALERAFTERDFESGDMASWPAMVEQISSFITDIRSEYAKLYEIAFGDDARDQVEQVCGNLESLDDAVRRTVHWGQETAEEPPEESEEGARIIEEDGSIVAAYNEAWKALMEAAPCVEKLKGKGFQEALARLVYDTCTMKNLGYRGKQNRSERRITAIMLLGMVVREYHDMYLNTEFPDDQKHKEARDAIQKLQDIIRDYM